MLYSKPAEKEPSFEGFFKVIYQVKSYYFLMVHFFCLLLICQLMKKKKNDKASIYTFWSHVYMDTHLV